MYALNIVNKRCLKNEGVQAVTHQHQHGYMALALYYPIIICNLGPKKRQT